jgi:hypothetical protein
LVCSASFANLELAGGAELGIVGDRANRALDVSVSDARVPPAVFADQHEEQWTCPLDEFEPSSGSMMRALLGGPDGRRRTVPPTCGEYMQDVPGTASGNWSFHDDRLALIYDRADPDLGVISTVQHLQPARAWRFRFGTSGHVNRDFRQVTADGTPYCYDAYTSEGLPLSLVIQVSADESIRLQQFDSTPCGTGPWGFDRPQYFVR